jgi:hypothetical protein
MRYLLRQLRLLSQVFRAKTELQLFLSERPEEALAVAFSADDPGINNREG